MQMKTMCVLALLAVITASTVEQCAGAHPPENSFAEEGAVFPDTLDRFFKAESVEGTFLLYDLQTARSTGHRPDLWDSAYIPASTFKIFNALVSLETGVIKDEQTVIPWDGIERSRAEWNRDHNLATAFRVSAVWFYQELARRVGADRMQAFLDTAGYGNKTMGGPIDRFWLDGGLRITPRQQVDFLVRLFNNDLPFSRRTMAVVRKIMVQEKTDTYTLCAKTGWADAEIPGVGWSVGYVERGNGVFFFATELQIRKPSDVKARVSLTRTILSHLHLL
jgi:beta-lactamase class D